MHCSETDLQVSYFSSELTASERIVKANAEGRTVVPKTAPEPELSGDYPVKRIFSFTNLVNEFSDDIKSELSGAETMCEVPFCYMRGSELCNGVIDLLYRKNGKVIIVDYKTTAEKENLDENYAAQLDEYKSAVKQILVENAEAFIYHIDV
ncbi:MAG: PD-(D/E)XK nuclease family protein [Ruminococcus sp.]|nr:PD-(D/E)XK nuclease family protein [Ruminococcus sp.]